MAFNRPIGALVALLLFGLLYVGRSQGSAADAIDAIVVLAGGVGDDGQPHVTVLRRLERAAQMYQQQLKSGGRAPAIVCNGGGTTHKPKFVDAAGYAIPEAALMGRRLETLGVQH